MVQAALGSMFERVSTIAHSSGVFSAFIEVDNSLLYSSSHAWPGSDPISNSFLPFLLEFTFRLWLEWTFGLSAPVLE